MFEKNLKDYYSTGKVGKCPQCGSKLIQNTINSLNRKNCKIKCEYCNITEFYIGCYNVDEK